MIRSRKATRCNLIRCRVFAGIQKQDRSAGSLQNELVTAQRSKCDATAESVIETRFLREIPRRGGFIDYEATTSGR
ncbi:hypothetical protein CA51_43390 [Rosistilla oblonga]|nr:hypothetical protein CA51_43390 [Rosistilla oblonga]